VNDNEPFAKDLKVPVHVTGATEDKLVTVKSIQTYFDKIATD
jgi:hypothetical protein